MILPIRSVVVLRIDVNESYIIANTYCPSQVREKMILQQDLIPYSWCTLLSYPPLGGRGREMGREGGKGALVIEPSSVQSDTYFNNF